MRDAVGGGAMNERCFLCGSPLCGERPMVDRKRVVPRTSPQRNECCEPIAEDLQQSEDYCEKSDNERIGSFKEKREHWFWRVTE